MALPERMEKALTGIWPEGKPLPKITISSNILQSLNLPKNTLVACDKATFSAAGKHIIQYFNTDLFVFSDRVQADSSAVKSLSAMAEQADFILAVGSGTINDLCKYVSYLQNKKYGVFATALSMNGYASSNASITIEGKKQSVSAHAPSHIYMDLQVLMDAPLRLTRSGLGDSIARVSAQFDWPLSHLLLGTKYQPEAFALTAQHESLLFQNAAGLAEKNLETYQLLAELLLLSGFAMTLCEGSYPASQSEHILAHYLDEVMKNKTLHGELVGITTLACVELQESFLRKEDIKIANSDKKYNKQSIDTIISSITLNFSTIISKLAEHHMTVEFLHNTLLNAGAFTLPEQLSISNELWNKALVDARFTRDRFTILDILALCH